LESISYDGSEQYPPRRKRKLFHQREKNSNPREEIGQFPIGENIEVSHQTEYNSYPLRGVEQYPIKDTELSPSRCD